VSFYAVGELWNAVVEQAFGGGGNVTRATWLFRDLENIPVRLGLGKYKSAGAEYHLGLAQAMNVGLSQYIDTRILVNLYHTLPEAERSTLGSKLLAEATRINPFNPEPWYLLAYQARNATEGMEFARHAIKTAGNDHFQPESEDSSREVGLENFVELKHPKPVEEQIHNYWRTVNEYVTRFAVLRHPDPADESKARQIFMFLKTEAPGLSPADLMPYRLRIEGKAAIKSGLIAQVRAHLQAGGKQKPKQARAFAAELNSFVSNTTLAEREQFLLTLRKLFPRDATRDLFLEAINSTLLRFRL
jgi:hypothetical protein